MFWYGNIQVLTWLEGQGRGMLKKSKFTRLRKDRPACLKHEVGHNWAVYSGHAGRSLTMVV